MIIIIRIYPNAYAYIKIARGLKALAISAFDLPQRATKKRQKEACEVTWETVRAVQINYVQPEKELGRHLCIYWEYKNCLKLHC